METGGLMGEDAIKFVKQMVSLPCRETGETEEDVPLGDTLQSAGCSA
jgi:hypothetical protein